VSYAVLTDWTGNIWVQKSTGGTLCASLGRHEGEDAVIFICPS
jgi:hypothetical protein